MSVIAKSGVGAPGAGFWRAGTADDVAAIRALTRAAYAKWVPVIGREPLPMTADYAAAVRNHRFDLHVVGETLVALVETISHPDHLWVENIAVSPGHGRQGLGRRMIAKAEDIAAEAGHPEIRLLTNEAFSGNVAFYVSAGYDIVRREDFRGGVAVHFRKAL